MILILITSTFDTIKSHMYRVILMKGRACVPLTQIPPKGGICANSTIYFLLVTSSNIAVVFVARVDIVAESNEYKKEKQPPEPCSRAGT